MCLAGPGHVYILELCDCLFCTLAFFKWWCFGWFEIDMSPSPHQRAHQKDKKQHSFTKPAQLQRGETSADVSFVCFKKSPGRAGGVSSVAGPAPVSDQSLEAAGKRSMTARGAASGNRC